MAEKVTGRCACGAVAYEVNGPLRQIVACHCEQCRRTSGHFVAATATRKCYFTLLEQRGLKWFEAVPGFRRGFCDQCGSSLFFEKLGGERLSIAAGSLDNSGGLAIAAHIYTAECGSYYTIEGDAERLPEAGHSVPLP
jgi:hypothetical protein